MGKETEVERGDEIKKFQKTILQTQNLGRTVNRECTEWGLGREENLPLSEENLPPPVKLLFLFLFFSFSFSNLGIEYNLGLNFLVGLV